MIIDGGKRSYRDPGTAVTTSPAPVYTPGHRLVGAGEALNIVPWWPQGHYIRALILGETGNYATAIVEMQRYLALVPDASNARAVQDQIYVWERREKLSAAPGAMQSN